MKMAHHPLPKHKHHDLQNHPNIQKVSGSTPLWCCCACWWLSVTVVCWLAVVAVVALAAAVGCCCCCRCCFWWCFWPCSLQLNFCFWRRGYKVVLLLLLLLVVPLAMLLAILVSSSGAGAIKWCGCQCISATHAGGAAGIGM